MLNVIRIQDDCKHRERQITNALLALATGILALVYPESLYLIAGGYLVALGALFFLFKLPTIISAFPIVTGAIIFIFPDLIPITFAIFLGIFGLIFLFSFSLTVLGILTLIISALIFTNPDSVAYFIASFMLLYAVNNLLSLFRNKN